jgi:hypothetical protein
MEAAKPVKGMTDEEIDAWLEEVRNAPPGPPAPEAASVEYIRSLDVIVVKIDDGSRLVIQRELIQGLEDATPEELSHIEIISGEIIGWPDLDVHHHLERLMAGKYATERWKQARKQRAVAA